MMSDLQYTGYCHNPGCSNATDNIYCCYACGNRARYLLRYSLGRKRRNTHRKPKQVQRKYYGDQPSRLSLTERIEQIARRDMATLAPTQAA